MIDSLSKALQKLSSNICNSKTTVSSYYTIGCIKVRLSDHTSTHTDYDLDIFNNGKSTYVVIPNIGTHKNLQWFTSIKDVIDFVIQFEKFAKMLVKPYILEQPKSDNSDYNAWKKMFHNMYVCKQVSLAKYLDRLYELSKSDCNITNKLKSLQPKPSSQKLVEIKKLLNEF